MPQSELSLEPAVALQACDPALGEQSRRAPGAPSLVTLAYSDNSRSGIDYHTHTNERCIMPEKWYPNLTSALKTQVPTLTQILSRSSLWITLKYWNQRELITVPAKKDDM